MRHVKLKAVQGPVPSGLQSPAAGMNAIPEDLWQNHTISAPP
jgi:hypothetical protein